MTEVWREWITLAVVRQGYEGRVCGEQLYWVMVRLEGWPWMMILILGTSSGLELEEGSGRTGLVSIMSEGDQFLGAGHEVGEEGGGVGEEVQ